MMPFAVLPATMFDFTRWILGAIIIATVGVTLSSATRLYRAIRSGEIRGVYFRLVLSLFLHALGVLLTAAGKLYDDALIAMSGLVLMLLSKQIWQIPGQSRWSKVMFYTQLAVLAAWSFYCAWG